MSKTTRQLLHEFGTTYRVLTADERKEDLDKVEAAIDAKFRAALGENPPKSEWWRYSGEPLGQIQLRDQTLARWQKGDKQ